jgi:hypothetical protein
MRDGIIMIIPFIPAMEGSGTLVQARRQGLRDVLTGPLASRCRSAAVRSSHSRCDRRRLTTSSLALRRLLMLSAANWLCPFALAAASSSTSHLTLHSPQPEDERLPANL